MNILNIFLVSYYRQGPYPDELEEGYSAVGAPSAAQQLQAGGPMPDVTCTQVDKSKKKKKTKAPVTDVYADVDKSKKSNKKRNKVRLFPCKVSSLKFIHYLCNCHNTLVFQATYRVELSFELMD